MGEERGVYRVLVGKPEGKRPLGRARRRWVDNIRMDLQEVGCGYMDWIGLAQDRDRWRTLVSVVMNLRVPWIAWNFLTICKPISFSRRTLHRGVSKFIYCCVSDWNKLLYYCSTQSNGCYQGCVNIEIYSKSCDLVSIAKFLNTISISMIILCSLFYYYH